MGDHTNFGDLEINALRWLMTNGGSVEDALDGGAAGQFRSHHADGIPRWRVIPHGSSTGYLHHGCRCRWCRRWVADRKRAQNRSRHQRMVRGEVEPPHGVDSTYSNYMCRCERCTEAHSAVLKARRAS